MALTFLSLRARTSHTVLKLSLFGSRFRPFSSVSQSDPPLPELVGEIARILSDYRSPHHDIQSALHPFSSKISSDLVEQVLKRCKFLGFSAHRFFLWARDLPGFQHSKDSHHILVDILGSSKQFPLIWDFLVELRDTGNFVITPQIFWIVFRAYSKANLPADAIRAFNKMTDFGVVPSIHDVDQLLFVLCKRKHAKHSQEFFDKVKKDFDVTAKTYSILIRGWGDIGEVGQARKLFDELLERGCPVDLPAYNSIMESLCKGGNVDEANKLFSGLSSMGFQPDAFSYCIFIHAFCEKDDLHSALRVLDRMKRYNLVPNVYTYNVILKKLCKNDKVDEAYKILVEMVKSGVMPDVWSYNAILYYHCDNSEVNRALKLISSMDHYGCQLDRHSYNMVLKMLVRVGRFDRAEEFWKSMDQRGFHPPVSTYAVMIHGLCKKKDKLEEACKYFELMIDEGLPPYPVTCELLRNKLIGFGFSELTEILADKMDRSTSCSIQELSSIMRGNKVQSKVKCKDEYSDDSDDWRRVDIPN
ncbi:OLC1v1014492C1 [Oldenlandia corymbosa var. corymbosa]|uniref:OLC1v1014492C1 n=1 Tax=Oldenlandia corymbosa var. corymbosa TaxID=529605 RepID=A0AAV1E0T8_OLDCO|nr:OLC1v1014492C1 [Oldenlandia corymbosa var. corymbosa]